MQPEDQNAQPEGPVERRAALRRGAAVIAGVAGLSAAAAAVGPAAGAAPGDPVVQGAANDAGASTTALTGTATGGTLQVTNTGTGAPLRVTARAGVPADTSTVGDHHSATAGGGFTFSTFTHLSGTSAADPSVWGLVYTDIWATQPIPVVPTRVLDTRSAAGRANILNPAGNLDSSGRLLAGHTITLNFTDFLFGPASVFANVTVTGTAGPGFVAVYPADPRPTTSTVNFAAGQTLSNFSLTGLNFDGNAGTSTLRIFALATTHVLFDVTAFGVGSTDFINSAILAPAARSAGGQRGRIDLTRAPEWFRQKQANRGS